MADALIAIAGSSGLIGSALVYALRATDHRVVRIVRRAPSNADELFWNPDSGRVRPDALRGVDAVVNLCGVGVGDKRWSGAFKQSLRDSRIDPTEVISAAVVEAGVPVADQRQRGRLLRQHRRPDRRRNRLRRNGFPRPAVRGLGSRHPARTGTPAFGWC